MVQFQKEWQFHNFPVEQETEKLHKQLAIDFLFLGSH